VGCTPLPSPGGQSPSDILFSCLGADRCTAAPCEPSAWTFVAQPTLPRSFFDPPVGAGAARGSTTAAAGDGPIAGVLARESGLQITPDGARTLISKDVGGERWAITRNLNDGTVTGNVYLPDGGDPSFLFCSQSSATVESVDLSCFSAGSCLASPCGGTYFSFIADVTLPQAFFAPPGADGGGAGAGALEMQRRRAIIERMRSLVGPVAPTGTAVARSARFATVYA
jgi:hypothetical protein